ncbi:MAG TPA: Fe-S biogenesis protein NfuA [Gammaproteobacteria bacterium]|nr:Fe-S biogenesis protein NfuA [Gammaproteobacteria bacterium]
MIEIKSDALEYLQDLLSKQEESEVHLRIMVQDANTVRAKATLAFCPAGSEEVEDICLEFDGFKMFVESEHAALLDGSTIGFEQEGLSGQLTIKTPNLKVPEPDENASLEERVEYLLDTEVNPSLAAHGGFVSLVEITPEKKAVLQFGGGCQGCGAVDITLKQGIETTLLGKLPELTGVLDDTNHSLGENPYYSP